MVEAGIALPIFLLIILGIMDLSSVMRGHIAVLRALEEANHALAGASSVNLIREEAMFNRAAEIFVAELHRMQVPLDRVVVGTSNNGKQDFILIGEPFLFPSSPYLAPRAYEISTKYQPQCHFCKITGIGQEISLSSVAVLETGGAGTWANNQNHSNDVVAYFPNSPNASQRVQWVKKNKL